MTLALRRLAPLLGGLVTLLLVAAQPVAATAPVPASLTGTVTWVHDADTMEIAPHGKVRLLGIDAPEKTRSSRDDKFLALGASARQLRATHAQGLAWCIREIKGRQVTLSFDRTRRDRHGRLLAYVHLADGRLLNRVLLEEGLVIVYRRFPFRLKNDFLAVETSARKRKAGLWAPPLPPSPPTRNE